MGAYHHWQIGVQIKSNRSSLYKGCIYTLGVSTSLNNSRSINVDLLKCREGRFTMKIVDCSLNPRTITHQEGFLTLFSIEKHCTDKYTQLKWLWIAVSAVFGLGLSVLSWLFIPQLLVIACIAGTVVGADLFFLFLKSLY